MRKAKKPRKRMLVPVPTHFVRMEVIGRSRVCNAWGSGYSELGAVMDAVRMVIEMIPNTKEASGTS